MQGQCRINRPPSRRRLLRIVLMMSLRTETSCNVFSAPGSKAHTAGPSRAASPSCSNLAARPTVAWCISGSALPPRAQAHETGRVLSHLFKLPVETGPAFGIDLARERGADVQLVRGPSSSVTRFSPGTAALR